MVDFYYAYNDFIIGAIIFAALMGFGYILHKYDL